MVKLLACGARGPGFDSRSRRYDFRDLLSPASSRDMAEKSLKRRKSSKQPTNISVATLIVGSLSNGQYFECTDCE